MDFSNHRHIPNAPQQQSNVSEFDYEKFAHERKLWKQGSTILMKGFAWIVCLGPLTVIIYIPIICKYIVFCFLFFGFEKDSGKERWRSAAAHGSDGFEQIFYPFLGWYPGEIGQENDLSKKGNQKHWFEWKSFCSKNNRAPLTTRFPSFCFIASASKLAGLRCEKKNIKYWAREKRKRLFSEWLWPVVSAFQPQKNFRGRIWCPTIAEILSEKTASWNIYQSKSRSNCS